jgi:hypothetical protein
VNFIRGHAKLMPQHPLPGTEKALPMDRASRFHSTLCVTKRNLAVLVGVNLFLTYRNSSVILERGNLCALYL